MFVYLRNGASPNEKLDAMVDALTDAGQPTLTVTTGDGTDLGRLFFIAEYAVAVAGWALEINPFDQPNVQEAKDNTNKVLESGSLPHDRGRRRRGAEGAAGREAAALRGDPRLPADGRPGERRDRRGDR